MGLFDGIFGGGGGGGGGSKGGGFTFIQPKTPSPEEMRRYLIAPGEYPNLGYRGMATMQNTYPGTPPSTVIPDGNAGGLGGLLGGLGGFLGAGGGDALGGLFKSVPQIMGMGKSDAGGGSFDALDPFSLGGGSPFDLNGIAGPVKGTGDALHGKDIDWGQLALDAGKIAAMMFI